MHVQPIRAILTRLLHPCVKRRLLRKTRKPRKSPSAVEPLMSPSCIKPMQPLHSADVSLSSSAAPSSFLSSPPPHSVLPLVRAVSSSSSSSLGASLTHHRRRASQSHRLSRRTLSTPLQDQAFNISSYFFDSVHCIPFFSFKIAPIQRCVWLGCPQLPHLAWEFTSEVISVS